MPAAADLPESLQDLAYINAAPVDIGRDFRAHMDRLIRSLDGLLGGRAQSVPGGARPGQDRARSASSRTMFWVAASAAMVLLIGGGIALMPTERSGRVSYESTPTGRQIEMSVSGRSGPPTEPTSAQPGPTAVSATKPQTGEPARAPPPTAKQVAAAPTTRTFRVLPNVSGGVQNLRSGPALRYPIVFAIPAGATGIALGPCRPAEDATKPWCAATWRNYSGFISSCCIVDERTGAPPRVE
jgi:hypothetical protein